MSGDRDSAKRELEQLARGYRDPKPPAPPDPEIARRALIDLSLGMPSPLFGAISIVSGFAWVLVGLFVGSWLVGTTGIAIVIMFAIFLGGLFGTVWVLTVPVARAFARRQRAWLAALDLPIDRPAYVELFGVERQFSSRMILTIEMTRDSDPDAQALLVRAATRACRGNQAAWKDRSLVVTGREVTTSSSAKGGTSYNNHALHRWFRRAARRFLIPAARAYGLARVQVEIR